MKFKILTFILILFFSCKKEETKTSSQLDYIPQNASIIIKINDFDLFKSELKNNNFLKEYKQTKHFAELKGKVNLFDYLKPEEESIISIIEVGKESFEFLLKTKTSIKLLDLNEATNKTIEELTYENYSYNKITLNSETFYSYILNESVFITSSQLLIENLIRTKEIPEVNSDLKKLYNTSNKTKPAVIFINSLNSNSITSSLLNENSAFKLSDFSDWVSLDLLTEQNELKLSGISNSNSSTKFISLFENVKPLKNNTPLYAPINSEAIASFTFDNFDEFHKNNQKYLELKATKDTVFNSAQEIGIIYTNNKKSVILESYNTDHITEYLTLFSNKDSSYQGNDILSLNKKDLLIAFESILPDFETNYYSVIENTIVFSEDIETLQNIISSYKNEATFEKSSIYNTSKKSIVDESNILLIASPKAIEDFINDDFKSSISNDIKSIDFANQILIGQVVSDHNFAHTSIILKKEISQSEVNMTTPLFTVRLDSDIATQPQFVTNYRTRKKEIIVQDQDNNLYLISTEGKVLWKKQLDGKVQGKIEQVDIYKNGRLQFAFTTENSFLILDRNGKTVEPFNIQFDGGDLKELAVFDYENNKDYRFLITQNKQLKMYDNKGEIVNGFNFKDASSPITSTPKHFRIQKKDYIAFSLKDGTLKILSRVGSDRIQVKEKMNFSGNSIFKYKNKISTTDSAGVLHQVDQNGAITKSDFKLNKDHGLYTTSNTLVTMNDNVISIKGKKTELELGLYSKPIIFYINNKIYVSVTDIQNQKIYLFDSNSNPIQNFPIYGNSLIDLADINNDKKLELVAKDLENSLIVYKIN